MKVFKLGLVVMAVGLMTFGLMGTAGAFHSGGVAECGGCHSMHTPAPGSSYLMLGTDPSSTCLNCHQNSNDTGPSSYHISTAETGMPAGTAPLQLTPGGDFGWIKKTYTFILRNNSITEEGSTHGHNIVAADYSYDEDPENSMSPGGSFDAGNLACIACHDPHGKYRRLDSGSIATTGAPIIGSGSYDTSQDPSAGKAVGVYRLLAGNGYGFGPNKSILPGFTGSPAAVAPSSYNRTEATSQTRVSYGTISSGGHSTWGNWCGACHQDMHDGNGNIVHPIDRALGSSISLLYQGYRSSSSTTGNAAATSYLSLVPFMQSGTSYTALKANAKNDNSALAGPTANDQVSCLSCHRAHASGWEYGLRWNMEGEFLTTDTGAWPADRGRTTTETAYAYYNKPASDFGFSQRVLCNKCHVKD